MDQALEIAKSEIEHKRKENGSESMTGGNQQRSSAIQSQYALGINLKYKEEDSSFTIQTQAKVWVNTG